MKSLSIKFRNSKRPVKTINLDNKNIFEILVIKKGIERRLNPKLYFTELNFRIF